jgi:hypothetical protein
MVITVFSTDAYAWVSKSTVPTLAKVSEKKLSKRQRKHLALQIVKKVVNDEFFSEPDLAHKLALALFEIDGDDLDTNSEEFTNLILNTFLSQPRALIVNQDLKFDLSMDFKLMWYKPELLARKKGILLGADYVVSGELKSRIEYNNEGVPKQLYTVDMHVKDIRSGKIIVTQTYTVSNRKGKRRK